jgi:hypothetical protein
MTSRWSPIYVLAMRICTSVKGAGMTLRKLVGRGPWHVERRS